MATSGGSEREHAAAAGNDDEHAADAHRRRRNRVAVGRHARLRFALGAREPVQRAARIAEDDRLPHRHRCAEAAEHERFRSPGGIAGGRSPGVDPVRSVGAEQQLGIAADGVGAADGLGPGDVAELRVDAADRGLERARADQVAAANHRADQVGETLDLIGAARRAERCFPAQRRRHRIEAGHARALADDEGVLEGDDDTGLRQRQRVARPLHLPQLDAIAGVEGVDGAVDAEDEDRPPATSGAVATRTPTTFFHLTRPPSRTTSSPSRVTTAATLPSLPTPAEILAPTLARQTERPLSASTARTLPSVAARVSTLPLTATVSGNWTAPMFWFQAGRTVIGATIGSSSFGLGFSR